MDIASGISAVVETAFKLAKLTLGGVMDAGAAAFDSGLSPDERSQRVLSSCLKLLIPTCVLIAVAWWVIADRRKKQRIHLTESLVTEYADALHQQRDANDLYRQAKPNLIDARRAEPRQKDAWGRPFRVEYARHKVHETLTVTSAGNDGEFKTRDDIAEKRQHALGKHIAKEIGNAVGDKVKGLFDKAEKDSP